MVKSRGRIEWIDIGKGLSITLVVLYHSTDLMHSTAEYPVAWISFLNEVLSSLRMPVFFLISGLLARKWIEGTWGELFSRKLALLVWVYIVWTLIEQPTKFLATVYFEGDVAPQRQLAALILSPLRTPGTIWFIWALVVFFVLAKLTRRLSVKIQLLVAGAASIAAHSLPQAIQSDIIQYTGLGWIGVANYYILFLLGYHFCGKILGHANNITALQAALVISTWLAGALMHRTIPFALSGQLKFIVDLIGAAAGVTISVYLCRLPRTGLSRLLSYLGSRTMAIYLAHFGIITLILVGLHAALPSPNILAASILCLFITALAVILSLYVYRLARGGVMKSLYNNPPWFGRTITRALRGRAV